MATPFTGRQTRVTGYRAQHNVAPDGLQSDGSHHTQTSALFCLRALKVGANRERSRIILLRVGHLHGRPQTQRGSTKEEMGKSRVGITAPNPIGRALPQILVRTNAIFVLPHPQAETQLSNLFISATHQTQATHKR